ncbi:MAG: HDOD domain-containing protein [Phycisphaerales bacterium]
MPTTTKKPTVDQVLNCPNLPTLPTVAVQLLELIRDPDVGINDIKRLVESDTGLAGRVLKTVNSSAFGLRQRCNNIQRALSYMGLNSIKSLVLGFSLVDWTKAIDGEGVDTDQYWRRVIYSAAGARIFALNCRACDPDDAFTGALFQDMGILAMLTMIGTRYSEIAGRASENHDELPVLERETLGFDHAQTGAALGEKWRLPDSVIQCIRHHHDPSKAQLEHRDLVRMSAIGRLCAAALTEPDTTRPVFELCECVTKWYAINREQVIDMLDRAANEGQELARLFDQNIGSEPDISHLLAEAGEQLLEHQMAVARQVTDLEQEKESLQKSTLTDAMTGAWNRKMFDQMIEEAHQGALKSGAPITVVFMDGDKFKSVNDTYGHLAGDKVIQTLAQRMSATVADEGTVCRYGGEEFAAVIAECDEEKAQQIAESIRAAIANEPFDLSDVDGAPDELPITVSIGVSVRRPKHDNSTTEQIVHEADQAVYASKRDGRNRVTLYKPELETINPLTADHNAQSKHERPPTAAPDANKSNSTPTPAQTTGSQRSVLVLEDDTLAARLLDAMFRREPNVDVECVTNTSDISSRVAELKNNAQSLPDLVIVDLIFPGISGVDLIKELRSNPELEALPIIVLTASHDAPTIRAARNAGANAVYSKQDVSRHIARWTQDVLALTSRATAA